MMDIRQQNDFKQFMVGLNEKLANTNRYFTGRLAVRLSKAAQQYPADQTIIQMASFLSSRASAPNGHLISKTELKDVYNSLYSNATKCGEFLSAELGENPNNLKTPEKLPHHMRHTEGEGQTMDDLYTRHADQRLVSELNAAFDKEATYKPFSPEIAKQAQKICELSLPGEPKVTVVDGREFAILCQATYETPKGRSNVIIPVEVVKNRVLPPVAFLTQRGVKKLDNDSLEAHIVSTAGKNFRVNAEQIFKTISQVKFGSPNELNSVERAVMMLRASTEGTPSTHIADGIIYQELDKPIEDVKVKESPEIQTFANQLNSTDGSAEFVFGKNAINICRSMIVSKLASFGYSNPQIKIAGMKGNQVTFAVAISGAGFKVPMTIQDGRPTSPNLLLARGSIGQFSSEGVKSIIGKRDHGIGAIAMGYNLDNPSELIETVKVACSNGDFDKASEVLGMIDESGDTVALKYAFSFYQDALSGNLKKEASAVPQMKTVKIGGNIVEATTGLPVDRVYIDENGAVQSKYRRNMEHTEDVTSGGFMNAKILMGM